MKFFFVWLRSKIARIALLLASAGVMAGTFALYQLPVAAVIYPAALVAALWLIFGAVDYLRARKRHAELMRLLNVQNALSDDLPEADAATDADYRAIIALLRQNAADTRTRSNARYADAIDYFTAWAHQIKTPIASMRLQLQNEDTPLSHRLESDLFHVEQYVDMVMAFLRIGSDSTDYLFRDCALDGIIRASVRRFAGEFILRRLSLTYAGTDAHAVTDEKWLGFVLDQVLSNALKYTRAGGITIRVTDAEIAITDTGIGIAPQDLPRIFEKGYTGKNGRDNRAASGLGLYLCRTVCRGIGARITAESEIGAGTTVRVRIEPHPFLTAL